MKTKLWILALVGSVLLTTAPVLADDSYYVIGAGNKPVGKEITFLPYTINESGMYYLSRNLNILLYTGNAITVSASNVTVDLMGFTLNGLSIATGSAHGIWINDGTTGVEIRNVSITNFARDGVHCLGQNCRIIGLRVNNVGWAGISENGKNQVISCFSSVCGHEGIWSGGSSMLKGNTVNNNAIHGITAGNSSIVTGNMANGNTQHGIYSGDSCTMASNTVNSNGGNGMHCGSTCNLTNNSVINNTHSILGYGNGGLIQANQVSGNNGIGIYANSGITVIANNVYSIKAGIHVAYKCLVIDKPVVNNYDNGILTYDYCTVTRNTCDELSGPTSTGGIGCGNYCTITNNTAYILTYGNNCIVANNTVYNYF
jgi:parallel beta-helix repeat protein